MLNTPYEPWPYFDEDERAAVEEVLRSGKVNQWTGPSVFDFEDAYAQYLKVPHAIAVANGTLALELALIALDVGPGDEVIVSPRSFLASASCVLLRGAIPVFVDVDPGSGNLCAETISEGLSSKTKAIICVHLAGLPCDMDPIMELADQHGIAVIEDCAQAHGAKYKGRAVGSIGDFGAYSFCQDKILSTGGEGGLIVCKDQKHWSRMWSYKDHGKDYEMMQTPAHLRSRWVHRQLGNNYRMTSMQAVLGMKQLEKLDAWIIRRRSHADQIQQVLNSFDCFENVQEGDDFYHSKYKHYAYLSHQLSDFASLRMRVLDHAQEMGCPIFLGSDGELYREECFVGENHRRVGDFKESKRLAAQSLMFLVHPNLSPKSMEHYCQSIKQVLHKVIC